MVLEISTLTTTVLSLYFFIYNLLIWIVMALAALFQLTTLTQLCTLRRSRNYYLFFSGALFSIAGLPPLAGFFTKLFLFLALFNAPGAHYAFLYIWFLLIASLWFYFKNTRHAFTTAIYVLTARAGCPPTLLGFFLFIFLFIFIFIFVMDDFFFLFLFLLF